MTDTLNIVIDQGSDFRINVTLTDANTGDPLDTSNTTANAALRRHWGSANSTSFTSILSNGSLVLTLSANTTANMAGGRWVYDVKLTSATAATTRPLEGMATVKPKVT